MEVRKTLPWKSNGSFLDSTAGQVRKRVVVCVNLKESSGLQSSDCNFREFQVESSTCWCKPWNFGIERGIIVTVVGSFFLHQIHG